MPRARKKSQLPATLYSQLGPVKVTLRDDLLETKGAMGMWYGQQRTIDIQSGMDASATLQTLLHEMAHIILWDSGVHNLLSKKKREAVVDAVGTYLTAAVNAGNLNIP